MKEKNFRKNVFECWPEEEVEQNDHKQVARTNGHRGYCKHKKVLFCLGSHCSVMFVAAASLAI